ncbi:hypothetical protein [Hymenobacter yonginensis]|uniref:Uncharacterized protein n=1 Tax=Hymenobacter yonginensis TaxID=748197 RepID=A0ABY7PMC7_9BACT|nr:hypothetical protein [Hymenobacter yonginensis]WBO83175.1 hypothetical protein O9Z63_12380 [Hymenobacter yonginensis]
MTKPALFLIFSLICLSAQAQRRGVYNDLATALQQPDKVRVLDLRGQNLDSLPGSLARLQNVEAILLGMKLRNLWFYPRAWKYELHLKHRPAGGYLHMQGRGGGEYFRFNRFKTPPIDFCMFPKLRVLNVSGAGYFSMADTVASRMARCRPEIIVLGGTVRHKDTAPDINTIGHPDKYREAKNYLCPFKIKGFKARR